jgi:hypothetical protein
VNEGKMTVEEDRRDGSRQKRRKIQFLAVVWAGHSK